MAAFIGNYFQHIMDVLLCNGLTYEAFCEAFESIADVTVDSVKKSHTTKGRGNLPRDISPDIFYRMVMEESFSQTDELRDFARQFTGAIREHGMFPDAWEEKTKLIDGFSPDFDRDHFRSFIISLLSKDGKREEATGSRKVLSVPALAKGKKRTVKTGRDADDALSFSRRYFTAGARSVADASDAELEEAMAKLSAVFCDISSVQFKNGAQASDIDPEKLLVWARDYIVRSLEGPCNKEIMKIEGPLGSYKNRVMQHLYIALERKAESFVPVYIDIASYEKAAEQNELIGEKDFLEAFERDIGRAEQIVEASKGKKPLLLLDGARDFRCKNEALYYSIDQRIKKLGWYMVTCVDTDFTVNTQNKYTVHPLISNNYTCYWRISSMNLNRKNKSLEFIKNCISVFEVALPEDVCAENIYDSLVKLEFLTIDAYWLTYILNNSLNEILDGCNDISCLYDSICLSFLGSVSLVESAAEFAYEFEFGKRCIDTSNPYFDLRWRLMRKHRSVLDFLIAKFYIKKVSELNLENGTNDQNLKKLSFFNMVLQKSITRFVVAMLKGVDDYEKQIMLIARRYYDDLDLFGKSELTFWMARLQNNSRKRQCAELLRQYRDKELERYNADGFETPEEKRKAAFLIRGISVSLAYENDRDALAYYLDSLLNDKTANSVNRGFYLEYYGDKPYIPNKTLLDFEDDVTKGEAAFTVLCLSLDERIRKRKAPHQVAVLEVMTLCNLIQARIESGAAGAMDVSSYIPKCKSYLEWIMKKNITESLPDVRAYFGWFASQLGGLAENVRPVYNPASTLNGFSRACEVRRTGWVELKVPEPENIVEHMYNCWLIGMLYLPEKDGTPGYDKNDILKLLLIHDLAETVTGDVSRPVKNENRAYYEKQEREVMQGLFLTGTYPSSESLNEYMKLWNGWSMGEGINYRIAKDIDNIQTVYRFCAYYTKHPDLFTEEDVDYWLSNLEDTRTEQGRRIADAIILNNPEFKAVTDGNGTK